MNTRCSNLNCAAPVNCHEGEDSYLECEFWKKSDLRKAKKKETINKLSSKSNLSWTGEPFGEEDISQVSSRTNPVFIGVIGKQNAGKTTFLAMLYTLLLNGQQFENYSFAGSKTIIGWDRLYNNLKLFNDSVSFSEPTPSEYFRLFHLALKNQKGLLQDILISEAAGEVFSFWSEKKDDANAGNARWIHETSDGFILFIDCDDLAKRKNEAKTEIIDIAQMLKSDLKERPVIAVWSKADVKTKIHETIVKSLKEELADIFPNCFKEIDISNFSKRMPDEIVHKNNIKVIDWILENVFSSSSNESLLVETNYKNDFFLNYKGNE